MAGVQRCHEVEAALEDRPGQQLHPLRADRAQVGVDDDERPDIERRRDLEDRAQGGALSADAVDLGIGQREALQAVGGPDQQDPLNVVRWLGLRDHALRPVRRAGVRVDEQRAQVREVLDQAGLGGSDHVADGCRVLEAGDADHDVGVSQPLDLGREGRAQE